MRFRTPLVLGLLLWAVSLPLATQAQEDPAWPVAGRTPSHAAVADGPAPPYRVAWETELEGGPPVAGPVVGDGVLVVAGRSAISALDPETGEELWSVDRVPGAAGPPAVATDLVLYVEGGGEDTALVAVAAEDGEEAWRVDLDGQAPGGVTVAGPRAYVAARSGTVYAVEVEDGSVAWTYPEEPGGQRFESVPAVAGGLVLVTSRDLEDRTSFLHAVDEETGERTWRYRPDSVGVDISSASEGDGLVVAGTVDRRAEATAFDLSDGRRRWATPVRIAFTARQMPIVTETEVVLSDAYGHVYRLVRDDGDLVWTFRVPGLLLGGGSPSISGEAVLIGDQSGQLSAIDLERGLLVWKRSFGDEQVHPAAIDGDRVYVSARGGAVAGLEHDPEGRLLDEPSPTTLFVGRALLNYAAAAAIVGGVLVVLSLLLRRRRA